MNWVLAIALLFILSWTLWPNGLAAMCWSAGHAIGHRLAKRVFQNPSGELETPPPHPDNSTDIHR